MSHDNFTEGRKTYDVMRDGPVAPAALEQRTVDALAGRGLLASRNPLLRAPRIAAAVTAGLLLFVSGLYLGSRTPRNVVPSERQLFALFLRHGGGVVNSLTGEEEMHVVQQYAAWARSGTERHEVVAGEKLDDGGRLLAWRAGELETREIQPAETLEGPLQGYFLIRATDLDQAEAIARTCPHVERGGMIEIREIDRR